MISPWDGGDRRVLFGGLAAVAAWDLVGAAIDLLARRDGLPHPHAPRWWLALADMPALVIAVAVVGLVGLALAQRWRVTGFVVALASSAVLVEALAAVTEGPWRARFFVGAALLGAVLAESWTRWAGATTSVRERAAETGALAMLAATWFCAGVSKLLGVGLSWADAATLQAIALGHAHVDEPGLAQVVAGSPALARALALGTVAIQLAAPALLLGARMRLLAALALVTFHLGVAAVTRIGYWQPVALLLLFALPWAHWVPARAIDDDAPLATPARIRASTRLSIALAAIVMFAWWPGVRAYAALHHRPRALANGAAPVVAREGIDRFGPLAVGDALADGWHIAQLQREPQRIAVVIADAREGRAILWISPRQATHAASPFDGEHVAVAYGDASVAIDAFAPAVEVLAARLDRAAARGELHWGDD